MWAKSRFEQGRAWGVASYDSMKEIAADQEMLF
jgi:hypothetical protein